jgi:hypothetical protein
MAILDNFSELDQKEKPPTPNKFFGFTGLLGAIGMLVYLFSTDQMSETNLVLFSYLYVPLLVIGVLGFVLPPQKVLIYTISSLPLLFIFYEVIFPAL